MRIEPKHFREDTRLGKESTVALRRTFERTDIGKEELIVFLNNMLPNMKPELQEHWKQWLNDGGLKKVIGDKDNYNVSETLSQLRDLGDVEGAHLLKRAFALLSCDVLDPVSVEKHNPLQLYDDLSITDKELRSKVKWAGVANFLVFDLYADKERVTRFHIFPKSNDTRIPINQDENIHQHSGHLGSLILAGELVNQQFDIVSSKSNKSSHGLYDIKYKDNGLKSELTKIDNIDANMTSNYAYKAGEHYHVAGEVEGRESIEYPLKDTDDRKFHLVGNEVLSATLFGVDMSATLKHDRKRSVTAILPQDGKELGSIVEKDRNVRELDEQKIEKLIEEADTKIRAELSQIKKPNTVMDRGHGALIAKRAEIYRQNQHHYI
ncbi:MAG: hypothetical protein ABL857_00280 [Rickettsiales bacterium]